MKRFFATLIVLTLALPFVSARGQGEKPPESAAPKAMETKAAPGRSS